MKNDLLSDLLDIVKIGGEVIKKDYRRQIKIGLKDRGNLVTETDLKAEAAVTGEIKKRYPAHSIVCEEHTGEQQGDSGYVWHVDPVDGTTNFAHSFPLFCVSVGVEKEGRIIAGAVYNPILEELFYAHTRSGAYLNGEKIHSSQVTSLENALLVTGFAYNFREAGGKGSNFEHFFNMSMKAQGIRRTGSAALDLCFVACGRFDGFWEFNLNSWDTAAGWLILEEAGGKVTNLSGQPYTLSQKQILASNSLVHQEMINILNV